MKVKFNNIEVEFFKSPIKNKKLRATFRYKGKIHDIDFGNINFEHYYDRTGLLNTNLNHSDKKRKSRYLARAREIRDGERNLTRNNILSPNYWSIRILWGKNELLKNIEK